MKTGTRWHDSDTGAICCDCWLVLERVREALAETVKVRPMLEVVQELLQEGVVEELLGQRKESMSVGLVTGALAALKDALVKKLYGLTDKDLRQAA